MSTAIGISGKLPARQALALYDTPRGNSTPSPAEPPGGERQCFGQHRAAVPAERGGRGPGAARWPRVPGSLRRQPRRRIAALDRRACRLGIEPIRLRDTRARSRRPPVRGAVRSRAVPAGHRGRGDVIASAQPRPPDRASRRPGVPRFDIALHWWLPPSLSVAIGVGSIRPPTLSLDPPIGWVDGVRFPGLSG